MLAECVAIDEQLQPARDAIQATREKVQPLLNNLKRLSPAQREQATELMYKAEEAAARMAEEEKRRDRMLKEAGAGGKPRMHVSGVIHPRVTISLGQRSITFQHELKGPITIEERQIKNVTEAVAVNQLTGSVQILKSHRLNADELLQDFEPLSTPESKSTAE